MSGLKETAAGDRAPNLAFHQQIKQGEKIGEEIVLCADGKYRWTYELNLLKNPTVFLLVWKIFAFIFLGIAVFALLADACRGDCFPALFLDDLKILAYVLIGLTALVGLGYLLYAAIMGGKYAVEFEMDENGVNHRQTAAQAKKAGNIGKLAAAVGAARGNLTAVGIGLEAQRTELYTDFASIRKVKVLPRRDLMKVDGRLNHNQIYAKKADLPFVEEFIRAHCSNLK